MKLSVHGLDGLHMQLTRQRVVNMLCWGVHCSLKCLWFGKT